MSLVNDEALTELDGQLRLGSMPFLGWSFPLRDDVSQRQVDQLGRGLVTGEVALVANRLSYLAVQRFDGVGGVDDATHLRGEGEAGGDLGPAAACRATVHDRVKATPSFAHPCR